MSWALSQKTNIAWNKTFMKGAAPIVPWQPWAAGCGNEDSVWQVDCRCKCVCEHAVHTVCVHTVCVHTNWKKMGPSAPKGIAAMACCVSGNVNVTCFDGVSSDELHSLKTQWESSFNVTTDMGTCDSWVVIQPRQFLELTQCRSSLPSMCIHC
jgi:hypothetical protein